MFFAEITKEVKLLLDRYRSMLMDRRYRIQIQQSFEHEQNVKLFLSE